jgi:hypothetical protein
MPRLRNLFHLFCNAANFDISEGNVLNQHFYIHCSQNYEDNNGYVPPSYEEGTSSGGGLRMKLKEFHKRYLFCVSVCIGSHKLITMQTRD